jgi:hypothetical protein
MNDFSVIDEDKGMISTSDGEDATTAHAPKTSNLRPWLLAFAVLFLVWFTFSTMSRVLGILSTMNSTMQALSTGW